MNECTVEDMSVLTPKAVKDKLEYFSVPQSECWRIEPIDKHLDARNKLCEIVDFTADHITTMIEDICTT